ncbi:MAG: site-2 protease family protein [Candidatus Micrarchaeota archaeon]
MARQEKRKKPAVRHGGLFAACIGVIAFAIFYYAALTDLNNVFKVPLMLAILVGSGLAMQALAGLEGSYGLLVFRGERGFGAMRYAANKFSHAARSLADFGLSLGFGVIYSYYLFGRKDFKKFASHAIAVTAFFTLLSTNKGTGFSPDLFFTLNVAFGLMATAVQSLVMQGAKILTTGDAVAGATLIIPGVTIPWEGIIALFIAVAVHEIAHGILCMVEKLEVKNSGAVLFGVLPVAAFVEPNEAKMDELHIHQKRRILIAGITSNFFVFILFLLLAWTTTAGMSGYHLQPTIAKVLDTGTAKGVLEANSVLLAVNGAPVGSIADFAAQMKKVPEGGIAKLSTSAGEKAVTAGKDHKIGIQVEDRPAQGDSFAYGIMAFFASVFGLTSLINFALATINLLPVFFTDGYRLFYEEARLLFPSKNDKAAKGIAMAAGIVSIALILLNFIPNFR